MVKPCQPLLTYPSQARQHPLEQVHRRFINQVKYIPFKIPFIEDMAKMPGYAKFLKDLLDTHQQLENMSKVVLNQQCSMVVIDIITTK